MKIFRILLLLFLSLPAVALEDDIMLDSLAAPGESPGEIVVASGLALDSAGASLHAFSRERWKRITQDMDFSKEKTSPPLADRSNFKLPAPSPVVRYVLFGLVIVFLLWILFRLLKNTGAWQNKKVRPIASLHAVSPEENVMEAPLDKLFAEALAAGNFRLAVRLQYLILIRSLSLHRFIAWKKEKTNREYLYETAKQPFAQAFRDITGKVEYAWYGEYAVSENGFNEMRTAFNELMAAVSGPTANAQQHV